MQIPHPNLKERAGNIFRRVYRNQKIDVESSRQSLPDQLDLYIDHLAGHIKKNISNKDKHRIMDIIVRNNHVAGILNSQEFKNTVGEKKKLIGEVNLGLIFCIDGRIPAIFLGGRYAASWEVPASEIKVMNRKSDGKLIPDSNELCESLRKIVTTGNDLLEIVFAHTSISDPHHGCGAMAAKRKAGILDKGLNNEEANLKIISQKTLPAIENIYNDFRAQKGFEPLAQVGISGIYDTDTFGIILNYDQRHEGNSFSTTDLTNEFKDLIEEHFHRENLLFGAFKERFTYLKYLNLLTSNLVKITRALLSDPKFGDLQIKVDQYIAANYPKLNENQISGLRFILIRSVAFQYLIGSCTMGKNGHPEHAFSAHEEKYMAVSTRGMTIGKFDPQSQGFSSTPADPQTAISNIKTKISIMSGNPQERKQAYLLFICNPVAVDDLRENSTQLHKIMDANAELFRAILEDEQLGDLVKSRGMIPVPVLIEEDTREVLKIVDHSAYI